MSWFSSQYDIIVLSKFLFGDFVTIPPGKENIPDSCIQTTFVSNNKYTQTVEFYFKYNQRDKIQFPISTWPCIEKSAQNMKQTEHSTLARTPKTNWQIFVDPPCCTVYTMLYTMLYSALWEG